MDKHEYRNWFRNHGKHYPPLDKIQDPMIHEWFERWGEFLARDIAREVPESYGEIVHPPTT